MAKEDLSKLWEGLNLTEHEEDLVKLSDQAIQVAAKRGAACLMGLVVNERNFNKESFRSTMPQEWKVENGITFTELVEIKVSSFM